MSTHGIGINPAPAEYREYLFTISVAVLSFSLMRPSDVRLKKAEDD
jgi:hypothetical protein